MWKYLEKVKLSVFYLSLAAVSNASNGPSLSNCATFPFFLSFRLEIAPGMMSNGVAPYATALNSRFESKCSSITLTYHHYRLITGTRYCRLLARSQCRNVLFRLADRHHINEARRYSLINWDHLQDTLRIAKCLIIAFILDHPAVERLTETHGSIRVPWWKEESVTLEEVQ